MGTGRGTHCVIVFDPLAAADLDKLCRSSHHTDQIASAKMLIELDDLEISNGPVRDHDRAYDWISGVPIHFWHYNDYEMFYSYKNSSNGKEIKVLYVGVVTNQQARDNAWKMVEKRF